MCPRLGHDNGLDLAIVNERQEPLKASAAQALGGLAAIHDYFDEIGALYGSHRPNLGLLSFQRDPVLRLPVCGNSNVTKCFLRSHAT